MPRPAYRAGVIPLAGQQAFTLIELLVVIVIIGVIAGLALPVYSSVRASSDKTVCAGRLKQLTAASLLAAADTNGNFPVMHGYSWEPDYLSEHYMAYVLAPYVSGTVNQDPTKIMRCPAAERNPQEAWLKGTQYVHYRYNVYKAQNAKPLVGYSNAMVFFDTTFSDWTQSKVAHYPGSGAVLNVAYADGHIAPMPYATFAALDSPDNEQGDLFTLGWTK